jgi:hypothetical protein
MKGIAIAMFFLASSAFGQTLGPSAGYFGGYTFETLYYENSTATSKDQVRMSQHFAQLGLFYDGVYFEAGAAMFMQLGPQNNDAHVSSSGSGVRNGDIDTRFLNVDGRLLGKYPIRLSPQVLWFPLAGLEYSWNISYNDLQTFIRPSELSDLFFDVGAGFDVSLGGQGYLRLEGIGGLNLTPSSQDAKDGGTQGHGVYGDSGLRFTANVGFGWRL